MMLNTLWTIFQALIGYNLVLPLVLYALFLVFRRQRPIVLNANGKVPDYAIIVTAYEQTTTVPAAISSILQLRYTNFLVYVVADKCDITTLVFDDPRIIVLRPPETLGSNTRSHFYAIQHFKRPHERLTIIDSDNLADPEYLNELNVLFSSSYKAVQGIRKAKNLNTTIACLDAARDMYYHFFDGEALFALGSSATLAGSGMAFTVALYRECLEHLDITGAGFDKVLQYEIVSRGYRIAFAPKAFVYDEKTAGSDQLVKQRARWINTWFRYFKFGFTLLGKGIIRFDWNQVLFGIILLRPPLFIFLLLSLSLMFVNLVAGSVLFYYWAAAFICFVAGFMIALAHSKPDKAIYRSLINIPKFILLQVLSLVRSRKANEISVATTHFHNQSIDEITNKQ